MCLNQHFAYIDKKTNRCIDNFTIAFAGNRVEKVVKNIFTH